ncbi:MAG: hypothetical protein AB1442_07535 [Nitrospirota bacterium]
MNKGTAIKIAAVFVIIAVLAGGAWYYFRQVHYTRIEKILSKPGEFAGKTVTIEGEVKDRTSFFVVVKFFKVRDKTGEIIAVTKKSLPEIGSEVRLKGKVDPAFTVGDQKLLVFMEESIEESDKKVKEKK